MSNPVHAGLLAVLQQAGLIEYGAAIPGAMVRASIGIEVPEVGTKATFDALALRELAAVDYVRSVLLQRGMFLKGNGQDYRILLPSENQQQVRSYMASADAKLHRARLLQEMTPTSNVAHSNIDARLFMRNRASNNSQIGANAA